MLHFSGAAFEESCYLQNAYAPFLKKGEAAYAYLSLSCIDMDTLYELTVDCTEHIKIGTTYARYSRDGSYCEISSRGYRCIACQNFGQVMIPANALQTMPLQGFVHLNEILYQIARFRALYMDMLVLHASAVVYRDEAIMFSGIKGAGKSTQARLWLENTDAWILNYDKPVVKLNDEQVLVSGSPWGGKEDLAINEVRPVKALFFVHQAKENYAVRLSDAQAYARAHLNYFIYPLNEDIERRYNEAVIGLLRKVPMYDLYCTDTPAAVEAARCVLYPEEV